MGIKCTDMLTVAGELCAGPAEAHWRSSTSRSYYSIYHGCQDWHDQLKAPGSRDGATGGVHDQFIHQMKNPAPENSVEQRVLSKALAMGLLSLKIQRHRADYHLEESLDQKSALNAHARATELLGKLA